MIFINPGYLYHQLLLKRENELEFHFQQDAELVAFCKILHCQPMQ